MNKEKSIREPASVFVGSVTKPSLIGYTVEISCDPKASVRSQRMLNQICEKALMYVFQNKKCLIDDYMVKYVVEHEMLGTITM